MLPADLPTDLPSFQARFGTDEQCRDYLFEARWPEGFCCTGCGHVDAYRHKKRLIDECVACGKQHPLLAGTIFEQTAPRSGFREQVYEHEVETGADGTAWVALVNPAFRHPAGAEGLGLKVAWDARAMPALYEWQNLQEGNYVVGLEPGTQFAVPREEWKKQGELRFLKHGESVGYRLEITPLVGAEATGLL